MRVNKIGLFLLNLLCLLESILCSLQDQNCILSKDNKCITKDKDSLKSNQTDEMQLKPRQIKVIDVTPKIKILVGFSTASMFLIEG